MKIHFILFLFIIVSCNNDTNNKKKYASPTTVKFVSLKLVDSLDIITFNMPLTYDTSFFWVHHSDCGKPCDKQKYRFQSRNLPIRMESGWYWETLKDSVNSLTISHSSLIIIRDGLDMDSIRHGFIKHELLMNGQNSFVIFDTIRKINDRYFSIIAMEKFDSTQTKRLVATTMIKNNQIKFEYELLTKFNDSISKYFIQNSINLINTIRIRKGI